MFVTSAFLGPSFGTSAKFHPEKHGMNSGENVCKTCPSSVANYVQPVSTLAQRGIRSSIVKPTRKKRGESQNQELHGPGASEHEHWLSNQVEWHGEGIYYLRRRLYNCNKKIGQQKITTASIEGSLSIEECSRYSLQLDLKLMLGPAGPDMSDRLS